MAVYAVNLKNLLCQINTNSFKFHLDSSLWDRLLTPPVWRTDAVGGRSPFHWITPSANPGYWVIGLNNAC